MWARVGGLKFLNPPNNIEKRTSYNVFGSHTLTFKEKLDISFDMQLPYAEEVGYIVRVLDKHDNRIFNVFFDGRGNDYFELNREGYNSLVKIHFDRNRLRRKQWFAVRLTFDLDRRCITMSVDGDSKTAYNVGLPDDMHAQIIFGRSDYLIDVPSFSMRNLRICGADDEYFFPLKQVQGSAVYTSGHKPLGQVTSPYWVINDHYHWKEVAKFSSSTVAGHNYAESQHRIICFNDNALYTYDLMSGKSSRTPYASPCPMKLYLGTSFIDDGNARLYAYETFREGKQREEPSMASLDLNTMKWTTETTAQINEGQMHHHGAFYRPDKQLFTIYGGFANMRYNDKFYVYSIGDHRWYMVNDVAGKRFPRYFLSMGYDKKRYAYIFGGMGNESGDQTVGRRFFYDLHRFDTRTKTVKRLWNVEWDEPDDIVFVKGMIIQGNWFYTLGYSEFRSNSYMRLYRFSLRDGSHEQLGDSILIHPDRIETEANLFYDSLLHKFVATIQEFKDEKNSEFRAYIINTPVLGTDDYMAYAATDSTKLSIWFWLWLACVAGAAAFAAIRVRRHRKRSSLRKKEDNTPPAETAAPNTICIFGDFMMRDRTGHDISYMFTDKLRQIFCLLLQHNNDGGISSQHLGSIMWGDKTPDKIKNSRSVAMNHLRKALRELDGISVVYSSGTFRLNITEAFHCDYLQLMQIIDSTSDFYAASGEIFSILGRGKFLAFTNADSADSFKSATEERLRRPLHSILSAAAACNDYPTILRCAKYIFLIDPIDEETFALQTKVMKHLGMKIELQEAVIRFSNAYKKTYGEDYQRG